MLTWKKTNFIEPPRCMRNCMEVSILNRLKIDLNQQFRNSISKASHISSSSGNVIRAQWTDNKLKNFFLIPNLNYRSGIGWYHDYEMQSIEGGFGTDYIDDERSDYRMITNTKKQCLQIFPWFEWLDWWKTQKVVFHQKVIFRSKNKYTYLLWPLRYRFDYMIDWHHDYF